MGRCIVVACLIVAGLSCSEGSGPTPTLPTWRVVGTGHGFTCGLLTTGVTYCWGWNQSGETGTGASTVGDTLLAPTLVVGSLPFDTIVVGRNAACGLRSNGDVHCWGVGFAGRLGNGADTNTPRPDLVDGGHEFARLAAGMFNMCGVADGGMAFCWGDDVGGQLGNGAAGGSFVPSLVAGSMIYSDLDIGSHQACGLAGGGGLYCWGSGPLIGHDSDTSTTVPVAVGTAFLPFQEVRADFEHTCAVRLNGQAYCWGIGLSGKLGNGADTATLGPVAVVGGLNLAHVSPGRSHTCALTNLGAAYCWGANFLGELGTGATGANMNTPQPVTGGLTFRMISTGRGNACGVTTSGELYCWGSNTHGELGDGTRTLRPAPVLIGVPP